ncbi:DUF547 domain-containing protein [Hymenobacter qilianensis]|uniref:DUF547 domain-containing protein n=2 Tax=Hymenobacter qilianensis TaxID=1385715 RepID=A0ACB5PUG4_9BACT|nr:DUF547 domain-containing protein [Hymenobacter qilianensis]QNP51656.1 DUF547 domain-containing protein [Hymenobacter qilianensis]GGF73126.1 DUF547 domain-containing protein [Hymenobacter qilianensis]
MRVLIRQAVFGLLLSAAACQTGCAYVRYFTPLTLTSKNSRPVNHAPWDALLKKHVDAQGMVNYTAFQADSTALNTYLVTLSDNVPNNTWSEQERLAYWLNAYNAFTIQRVIRAYPLKSIRDLGGSLTLVNTVWDQPFIRLGNEKHTLNDIEQRIIRKKFEEPRIHFALVCAAMSCPRLRNEAYIASRLNEQLDDQATNFINDPTKNKLTPADKPEVSSIFNFYPRDFAQGDNTIQKTINRYATQKINPDATLSYLTYDWSVNEQRK